MQRGLDVWPDARAKKKPCDVRVIVTNSGAVIEHTPGSDCTCGTRRDPDSFIFRTRKAAGDHDAGELNASIPATRAVPHFDAGAHYVTYQTFVDGLWNPPLPMESAQPYYRFWRAMGATREDAAREVWGPAYEEPAIPAGMEVAKGKSADDGRELQRQQIDVGQLQRELIPPAFCET